MRLTLVAVLLLAPCLAVANVISVGDREIRIPTPAGFAPVSRDMGELYEMQALFVAPTNEEFITFVPEELVPHLLQGETPELQRRFSVQTGKSLLRENVSAADFDVLKSMMKTENDRMVRQIEELVPGWMERLNEGFEDRYQFGPALSLSELVPLPVHEEGARSLAFSAFTQYRMNDEEGQPYDFIVTATTTFVHVNDRMLFLYVYGGEEDLRWTREAASAWTDSIIKGDGGN